jgi:hypothetical protein
MNQRAVFRIERMIDDKVLLCRRESAFDIDPIDEGSTERVGATANAENPGGTDAGNALTPFSNGKNALTRTPLSSSKNAATSTNSRDIQCKRVVPGLLDTEESRRSIPLRRDDAFYRHTATGRRGEEGRTVVTRIFDTEERLIPLAPALPTCGDERAIGARLRAATDKMLIAPEATA